MTELRFAVIGINHAHIYGQVDCLLRAGAECVGFHAPEDDLAKLFAERHPQIPHVAEKRRLLEDDKVKLIVSADAPPDKLLRIEEDPGDARLRAMVFEFDRTASRLVEMQSKAYLAEARRSPE